VRRATLELLSAKGLGGVTLPAVARRAGVHKTTVYRWWASPSELLHEATAELEALALPELDTGSLAGDVEAFVESRLRLIRDPRAVAILRAVIAEHASGPMLSAWIDAFWKPRRKEWRSPIERAIARGELAASAREVPLVEIVAGPLLLTHLATPRRLTRRELRAVARVVVAGVVALHGRPPASGRGGDTAFAVKAEVRDPRAKAFAFEAHKTMYGGKHIAEGDTIFVISSENEGGQGLLARGVVTSAEPIEKKRGIARQTPRVSISVRRTALAKRPLGRSELAPFRDWHDGRPDTELNFKLYRQATDKIAGISEAAAAFLHGFF
jgi:AcrR family transcriptional regulator